MTSITQQLKMNGFWGENLKRLRRILWRIFLILVGYRVANWIIPLDFYLFRPAYEDIVRQVKATKMGSESHQSWNIRWGLYYGTLENKSADSSFTGFANTVRAARNGNSYNISIITDDMGHFGTYGYLYSNEVMISENEAGLPVVRMQMAKNWWLAMNNLH